MMQYFRFFPLFVGLFFVISCSGGSTRQVLGLGKTTPDEFKVISNPPLSLPPDFSVLPPKQSAVYSNDLSNVDSKIFYPGLDKGKTSNNLFLNNVTQAEQRFLYKAKTDYKNPDIRDVIDREYENLDKSADNVSLFAKVIGFTRGEELVSNDPVVDPLREKDRLANNQKHGKPTTDGEVKIVAEKNKERTGFLNRIFGF